MVWRVPRQFVLIAAVVFAVDAKGASAPKDISYATAITDDAGTPHTIGFEGQADGAVLTGILTVDGAAQSINAIIAKDGSISGTVTSADGKPAGKFWGQRAGGQVKGSFDLNGQVGDWSVPASKVPVPK
ncbi:MAG TPA: hypothetical protein VJ826_04105 [Candidatus Polarisedimenticolaceae bacterium]|nr:hypothetical protein [Candidatus Polarisedimenticolaceae bacterium]